MNLESRYSRQNRHSLTPLDCIYNSPLWGVNRFKDNKIGDQRKEFPKNEKNEFLPSEQETDLINSIPKNVGKSGLDDDSFTGKMNGLSVYDFDEKDVESNPEKYKNKDPSCYGCMLPVPDPHPDDLILCLHSKKYEILDHVFETKELPKWTENNYEIPDRYLEKYLKDYN